MGLSDPWSIALAIGLPLAGAIAWVRFAQPKLYMRNWWIWSLALWLGMMGVILWSMGASAAGRILLKYVPPSGAAAAKEAALAVQPHIVAVAAPAALAVWVILLMVMEPDHK